MPIPMGRLWTSSAVAGLLFLLPAGHANAQDNRNTWGWGATRGMLIFIASGAVGSIVGWSVSRLASKGKRGDGNKETVLARFDQLDNGVKVLNEKLTKLETTSKEEIHGLSRTLESKMNLGSKIHMVSTSLETIGQRIIKVEGMVKAVIEKKENNQLDQCTSNSNQAIGIHNNQSRPIIVDTSAIIDGRIIKLQKSGLLEELKGKFLITKLMKNELRNIQKPECMSQGYENLANISDSIKEETNISYDGKTVEEKLLQCTSATDKQILEGLSDTDKQFFLLTSETNGILITMDGRLTELCHRTNVGVLNLDELHKIIKPKNLLECGQKVDVKLKPSKHKDSKDAIANYDQNIMILVKNGAQFVNQKKSVRITSDPSHSRNGRTALAEIISPPDGQAPAVEGGEPPKTSPAP